MTSSATSAAGMQSCRMIAQQDWDAIREVLSTESGKVALRTGIEDLGIDGALHFACRFHPPLDVIVSMAGIFPAAVLHCDKAGRYPLHIAAKWGASPLVLRFLVEEEPSVCALQDETGKTPLHHICRSYGRNYSVRKNDGRPLKESLLEVVRGLCKASPSTVNLEDEEDMTALEYAIESDLDLKVVRTMQKACEKDWKNRRENAVAGETHDEVMRKMQIETQRNAAQLNKQLFNMSQAAMHASLSALHTGSKLPGAAQAPLTLGSKKANSCRALTA